MNIEEQSKNVPLIKKINFNYKDLTNRIETTERIFKLLSLCINCKNETASLLIIKRQYEKMYIAIMRNEEYQKYQQVENIIIDELKKIELNLKNIVYKTAGNYERIFDKILTRINAKIQYNEIEKLYKKIDEMESTKKLLILYSPYISNQARCKLKEKIASLKFNLLLRKTLKEFMKNNQIKYEQCFTEFIEEIVIEVQEIYNDVKTNDLEQKVYDIEISNEAAIEKLFIDFINKDDIYNKTNKIYETLLENFLQRIRSSQNFRNINKINSQIEKINMIEKILEEYIKYVS